jgi:hypothetical protein
MSQALYVAWRSGEPDNGQWGPVGRLEHADGLYRFVYTRGAKTFPGFPGFTGMPDLEAVYESDELFPLFANRLLAKSRPEYEAYLAWGGFDPNNPPDPLAILGVTEGRRATDSLEIFPCPTPDANGCYVGKFFLHGVRWIAPEALERVTRLKPDEALVLRPEPATPTDPNAQAIYTQDGVRIGYVPRYLAFDVGQLTTGCGADYVELRVERVNSDAPLQQRVLCRVNACWPDGFQPCNKDEFQPIVANLPHMQP